MKLVLQMHSQAVKTALALAALVSLIACQPLIGSAIPPKQNVSVDQERPTAYERYYRVLDLVFPRKLLNAKPSVILLTLRYIPAFEKESQIVISKNLAGSYVVTYYSLPEGRERISERIEKAMKTLSTEDPRAIADQIKVTVQNVEVPPEVVSGLMHRYAKVRVPGDLGLDPWVVHLDGVRYQLWFEFMVQEHEVYLSFPADNYPKDHPFYWMNEVKRVVEKYASND